MSKAKISNFRFIKVHHYLSILAGNVKIISYGLCRLFGEEDSSGPGYWGRSSN